MSAVAAFWRALQAQAVAAGISDRELRQASGPLLAETPALTAALAHAGGALLLLGNVGAGKTLAAQRWLMAPLLDLRNWNHDGATWYPRRQPRLLFVTAKSLSRVKQYDGDQLPKLCTVDRLVVDDLGQEYLDKSGFLASLVDEVMTERHRRGLPTAMTANLTLDEFGDRYGDRVVDRVAGDGQVVVCDGHSLRGLRVRATMPPAVEAGVIEVRARDCAAERARLAAAEAARMRAPVPRLEAPRSVHGSAAPLDAQQVAARKAEIARRLEEWGLRNGTTG